MNKFIKRSQMFLNRNASTILTCVGGAGVVVTSVMAVKATPKALKLLENAKAEKGEELTKTEVIRVAGPAYIPSIVVGVSTIACIFGANILNKRQQAALMSAYALIDNSYKEYRNKVKELYGEEADDRVREEIAKDHYDEEEISNEDDGKQLFYDSFSGRYFESTIEAVQRAEYNLNRDLVMMDCASVNVFYDYLGLDPIESGDEIGWSTGMNFDYYWQIWIDFGHRKVELEDGLECTIITFFHEPAVGYDEYN